MNSAHKIAVFREDVYILYVLEMARDCMVLLYLLSFEKPKNLRLADVELNRFAAV